MQADERVSTATHFLDALAQAQDPVGPPAGWLDVITAEGPVRFLLQSRGLALLCLERYAAATIAFSMAAFGVRFDVSLIRDAAAEDWKSLEHRGDQYRGRSASRSVLSGDRCVRRP